MEDEQLIPADVICMHYRIEHNFIDSLQSAGLIEITTIEGRPFIHPSQLQDLERFICFHYDLDINVEGIEAIASLLERVHALQREVNELRMKR